MKSWISGAICGVVLAVACLGCGYWTGKKQSLASPDHPVAHNGYPRFQPIAQASAVALDTKTGVICHILNSEPTTSVPSDLQHIPLCTDLILHETGTLEKLNQDEKSAKPIDYDALADEVRKSAPSQ